MNTYLSQIRKKTSTRPVTLNPTIPVLILTAVFAICMLSFPEIAQNTVKESASFCIRTLIPSLFPMLIASEILVAIGFSGNKYLEAFFEHISGISAKGLSAFILGVLCGVPVGSKTAVSIHKSGKLSKNETEVLSAVSNNPGPGFVIAGIGVSLFGDLRFGVVLYISEILSALIALRISKSLFFNNKTLPQNRILITHVPKSFSSTGTVLTKSVSSATQTMLTICGFVLFFDLILSSLSTLLFAFPFKATVMSILSVLLEITSGATSLATLNHSGSNISMAFSRIFAFTLVGWGGLSSHMQAGVFLLDNGIGMKKYYTLKILQALICTLIGILLANII